MPDAKTTRQAKQSADPDLWHLSRDASEARLTGFEFSLERVMHAFYRWKAACLEAVSDAGLTGNDVAVLNTIRMKERAKSRTEIARLLNREDVSNIQYALRKLLREGLIEKCDAASRKTATYRATEAGIGVTEAYAEMRRTVLIAMSPHLAEGESPFEEAGQLLDLMAGAYDQAAKRAATQGY
ncbi:MAG TPA: winged helix DNA-binding protein [Alphaproteobacteria bacterium]|nr:winged helix DNA-binding protein [Alphaproteobacteria bacterium]